MGDAKFNAADAQYNVPQLPIHVLTLSKVNTTRKLIFTECESTSLLRVLVFEGIFDNLVGQFVEVLCHWLFDEDTVYKGDKMSAMVRQMEMKHCPTTS